MNRRLLYGGVVLGFVLFFVLPVGVVYVRAFTDTPPGGALAVVGEILGSSRTASILTFTTAQAALSALLGVLIALPVAYAVSHYEFPGRHLIYSLSLIPFVLPSIIVVVCMISFYGKSGLVNTLLGTDYNLVYNFAGIVIAHVFYNFSLAVRIIGAAWRSIDKRYRETAESLGERRWGMLRRVTLPLLAPALCTGFLLIFIYTFLSFGIILVFGGVRFSTLETAIYQEMFVNLDLTAAAVYSIVQLVVSFGFVALSTRLIHASSGVEIESEGRLPRIRDAAPAARILLTAYLVLIAIFVLGPILTMIGRAFRDSHGAVSLENFRELLVPGAADRNIESIIRSTVAGVILRSIAIALASGTLVFLTAAALALSMRGRPRTVFESLLQLPIGASLVTVSLGLRLLWDGVVPPVMLIVIGQFFIAFPLVFRIVRTGVEELGDAPVRSAQILGAGRWALLRDIEVPLLKRSLLNAYAYAVALPFADLTVVLTAGRARIATFPVAIYRLIGFRSFDLALALATIYIVICLVLFRLIDLTSLRDTTA